MLSTKNYSLKKAAKKVIFSPLALILLYSSLTYPENLCKVQGWAWNSIALHRDTILKINFVREKKVYILTKEVNAKRILEIKAKTIFDYFLGHPVI